ncbi:MAG TPA: bifunctional UDP-N-acetylglucosamine diphosphorylase/glucosamine-1-phosphate N-acetyltransferase GlmU [Polyangiaceae bacterium]|nr:bifunctional UDP-N-acetylglucosamine diphosphorylase/glucosamine-1-phosphate N-acetyltransferase GlmU [Polyangiaceae bacterium]
MQKLAAIILAAGQGTRMKSAIPKVLHPMAGRPLIYYAVRAALDAGASDVVVVVGRGAEEVERYLVATFGKTVRTASQTEQRGTGHATLMAMPALGNVETTLVLYADTPLLEVSDLKALATALEGHPDASLALITCVLEDPTGYGRVLRDDAGRVTAIREHRDLRTEKERAITEVNPGVYAARVPFLRDALSQLTPNNAQNELYLTDVVEAAGKKAGAIALPAAATSLAGVNDRAQLAMAEAVMHRRIAERWARSGVTVHGDPRIDETVELAPDVTLHSGVELRGSTTIKTGASIDTGSVITDAVIEAGAVILPYSVITSSRVGPRARIGPFAHLRPESDIGEEAHVGNFVETKKTVMHARSKANHLAYLGDGEVGEASNVGAGTIFCNYDGFQKQKTTLGRGVFIGSDSQLVAPVTIGDGAYVATGATVTHDVPPDALAIGRARQENKPGYAAKLRAKLAARAKPKK